MADADVESLHRELMEPMEKFKTSEERIAFLHGYLFELTQLVASALAWIDDPEGEAAIRARPGQLAPLLNEFAHRVGDFVRNPLLKAFTKRMTGSFASSPKFALSRAASTTPALVVPLSESQVRM